ncbi:hypothetical protein GJA_3725 [Janthinobacterium agaricidamnosum NBRC 102515 = DSM 9628]|uniref:Uncharacterized protein n=1 Tax=Janthinobacterium agaricidamnosum NBRC 102515 = DSM 9628 TaxID=1349767 RepID=W0V9Q0_9BURK|nr:hypothetical protein GJA_3725 [Janthinobacterium agaricidamnosum NBRC 102515 = DSM 9628]
MYTGNISPAIFRLESLPFFVASRITHLNRLAMPPCGSVFSIASPAAASALSTAGPAHSLTRSCINYYILSNSLHL